MAQGPTKAVLEYIRSHLARIQFSRLGQAHQSIALIISKFRIGAWTNQNRRRVGIRKSRLNGGSQSLFYGYVWQHGYMQILIPEG